MSIDVGVGQLVQELEQRGDRLPFEIGAFVALEACEGLLQESVWLEADDVRVTAEGSVVVAPSAERAEPNEAAKSLVSVLSRLLVAAGPGVPPYLLQLVRDSNTGAGPRDLRHLHDAIEASLIPLNRGASRRVLARLVRESDRPPAPEEDTIDPSELDAELDELLADPGSRALDTPEAAAQPITAKITMPRQHVAPEPGRERISEPAPEFREEAAREATPPPAPAATKEEAARPSTPSHVALEPKRDAEPEAALEPELDPEPAVEARPLSAPEPTRESRPLRESEAEAEAATVPPPLPPAATQGSVVVSEQVKVDSAPPPTRIAVAAATAPEPASSPPEEAVTATIRVRFPEQEPQTAKIPTTQEPEPAPAPDSDHSRVTERPASEAVVRSATETTQQWGAQRPSQPEGERDSVASGHSKSAAPRESAAARTSVSSTSAPAPKKTAWAPWLLVLAVVGVIGVLLADGALDGVQTPVAAPAPPAAGTIALTVDPPDSQIFVFVGRGPAIAEGLSASGPHEFVVFDRGLAPSRTTVPEGAAWEATEDGPRYELAVQAFPLSEDANPLALGEPLTETSLNAGETGHVRIVTNPPGAKVYRFVGKGPSASIPVDSIHEGHELLIFHPDRDAQRAVIGPSDWRASASGDSYEAELEAVLPGPESEAVADSGDD